MYDIECLKIKADGLTDQVIAEFLNSTDLDHFWVNVDDITRQEARILISNMINHELRNAFKMGFDISFIRNV